MSENRLETSGDDLKETINLFKCPICNDRLENRNNKSLICSNGHCFDLSKKGYVNLLLDTPKIKYDKKMFVFRNMIYESGFFDFMIEQICSLIIKEYDSSFDNISILDNGSGEGSHLAHIINYLNTGSANRYRGVGIDISKEGVKLASGKYPNVIWCVADSTQMPFFNKHFHVILNLFSPANYSEFSRIIRDNGILIKVMPGADYLKELRNVFYKDTNKLKYSNERVIKHFTSNFNVVDIQHLSSNKLINKENLKHLMGMTPLLWGVDKEKIEKAINIGINSVTLDLTIIIGKRK